MGEPGQQGHFSDRKGRNRKQSRGRQAGKEREERKIEETKERLQVELPVAKTHPAKTKSGPKKEKGGQVRERGGRSRSYVRWGRPFQETRRIDAFNYVY